MRKLRNSVMNKYLDQHRQHPQNTPLFITMLDKIKGFLIICLIFSVYFAIPISFKWRPPFYNQKSLNHEVHGRCCMNPHPCFAQWWLCSTADMLISWCAAYNMLISSFNVRSPRTDWNTFILKSFKKDISVYTFIYVTYGKILQPKTTTVLSHDYFT